MRARTIFFAQAVFLLRDTKHLTFAHRID